MHGTKHPPELTSARMRSCGQHMKQHTHTHTRTHEHTIKHRLHVAFAHSVLERAQTHTRTHTNTQETYLSLAGGAQPFVPLHLLLTQGRVHTLTVKRAQTVAVTQDDVIVL